MEERAARGLDSAPARSGSRWGRLTAELWANRRMPAFLAFLKKNPFSGWSARRRWVVGAAAVLLLVLATPCLVLLWQVQRGGLALDMLTPWIARSLADQLGEGRSVTIGSAVAGRDEEGRVEVEARDVVIHDADGRRVASMPRLALGLDGLPILGRPAIRRIDLVGASVALKVGEDGQIALAAGRFRSAAPQNPRTPAAVDLPRPAAEVTSGLPEPELSPFRKLGIWLDIMEKSGLDGHRLAVLGLRNGSVIVDDVRSGKRFHFSGIDFDISAPPTGGLTFSVDASGSGARWNAQAKITPRDADGRRVIDLQLTDLSPRDLSLAVQAPETFYADTPITGVLSTVLDAAGDPASFSGRLLLGRGAVGDIDNPDLRVVIDRIAANVRWRAGDVGLTVERVELKAGEAHSAVLNGLVIPPARAGEPLVVQVHRADATTSVLNPHEAPIRLGVSDARFVFEPLARRLSIERATIDQGAGPLAYLTGSAVFEGRSPAVELRLAAESMPMETALALWPRASNPGVRDWVAHNLKGGTAEATAIRLKLPTDLLVSDHWVLEKDALSVRALLRGTSLSLLPGLSRLQEADIDVNIDGETARLAIARGFIEPVQGKRLTISRGTFEIPDHRVPSPRSVARFRLEGPADTAFALLGEEAFKSAATGPALPSSGVRGTVLANVAVEVPIADKFRPDQVDYRVEAEFSRFAADNAFGEMRLENAAFKVTTTPREFMLRGQGALGGAQASFEYRKPRPQAKPEIRLSATLDDRGRARLGLNIGPRIAGPTPVNVTTVGEDSGRYSVDVDLGQAVLAELLPGWNKPRGQAARARFTALSLEEGWKIEDLLVESRGVLVRGSATFDAGGALVSGFFPAYNLSDGDRMNVRVDSAPGGYKVTARGEMLDARALLKSLTEPPRLGEARASGPPSEIDIDLRANAVAGGNGEVLRQFEMRAVRRGTDLRSLSAAGRIGRNAPFAAEMRGQGQAQRLVVSAGDAGAVLRFLDLYRTLQGGDLALIMSPVQPDGSIRQGSIEITNFGVQGDQAISGMVAAAGEPPNAPRAARPPAGGAFAFSRLRSNFSRSPSGQVTVADGLLWGAAIGATVEGEVDPGRDRLRLRGTYVPAYALNNIFARIPLFGLFLGGAPDEGVFGITYQIAGRISAPQLTVNPLSAVTPGFLRKMFEFRGRSTVRPDDTIGAAQR